MVDGAPPRLIYIRPAGDRCVQLQYARRRFKYNNSFRRPAYTHRTAKLTFVVCRCEIIQFSISFVVLCTDRSRLRQPFFSAVPIQYYRLRRQVRFSRRVIHSASVPRKHMHRRCEYNTTMHNLFLS